MVPVRVSLAALITAVVGATMFPGAASASRAPSATNPVFAELGHVSCPSSSACFAAGSYLPGGRGSLYRPLIEQFNGTSWRVSPAAVPAARSSRLFSTACVSATDCIAVGEQVFHPRHGSVTLAEHWNGKTWSITPTPVPPKSLDSELNAVSCAPAGPCMAVGDQNFNTDSTHPTDFAERWDGTRWTEIPVAQPANSNSNLLGVSCRIASDCMATGWWNPINTNNSFPLFNHWDGTRWTVVPSAHPASLNDTELTGVSCPAASDCVAVGDFFTKTPTTFLRNNLSELWNGTHWSRLHTPKRAGSSENQLGTLSCPAAGSCMAVGEDTSSAGITETLAEQWNGQQWSILPSPNPLNSGSEFFGVSCRQVTLCVATGISGTSQGIVTLAEVWQGGTWRIVPTPSP